MRLLPVEHPVPPDAVEDRTVSHLVRFEYHPVPGPSVRDSGYHYIGSAGLTPFLFILAKTSSLRPKGTQCLLDTVSRPPSQWSTLYNMTECRAHAVIILPEVQEHWFPRASRTTMPAPVLSKAGSFGYPTTRTECARPRQAPEAGDRS